MDWSEGSHSASMADGDADYSSYKLRPGAELPTNGRSHEGRQLVATVPAAHIKIFGRLLLAPYRISVHWRSLMQNPEPLLVRAVRQGMRFIHSGGWICWGRGREVRDAAPLMT